MDPSVFDELLTPAGQALIREIHDRAGIESDLALGTRLRKVNGPELVAAAVTVNHLRGRAAAKFGGDAEVMYFTHDALEQATRRSVAEHRAARLRELGVTAVVDLGCGIGGDLVACARAGLRVRGVDLDPLRAAMASANLAALGLTGTVEVGDATATVVEPDEVTFVDPGRRTATGRRVFSTDGLVPAWNFVTELLAGRAVAKVMPGIAHADVPPGVEAEWVSDRGQLVEAALWGAGLALGAGRRATVLPSTTTLAARGEAASIGAVDQWLLEPDDAVVRAGLVAELAADVRGHFIDSRIAWISAASPTHTDLGRWFEVVTELPFREKQLRAALRERDIGPLTVKKRGVDIVPEQLVKRLKLTGRSPGTVVLTRAADTAVALLVVPRPPAAQP